VLGGIGGYPCTGMPGVRGACPYVCMPTGGGTLVNGVVVGAVGAVSVVGVAWVGMCGIGYGPYGARYEFTYGLKGWCVGICG